MNQTELGVSFIYGILLGSIAINFEEIFGIEVFVLISIVTLIFFNLSTSLIISHKKENKSRFKIFVEFLWKMLEVFIFMIVLGIFNVFRKVGYDTPFSVSGVNFYEWIYFIILNSQIIYYMMSLLKDLAYLKIPFAKKAIEKLKEKDLI